MSNKPTFLVEASFYETPKKVSSRYHSSPYAEHLQKSKIYFRVESTPAGCIYRRVVIEPRYDSDLANKRAHVFTVEI